MTQCLAVPHTVLQLVTCPGLPACILNQKKKTTVIKTGLLAYTLGDNLINHSRDVLIANPNSM